MQGGLPSAKQGGQPIIVDQMEIFPKLGAIVAYVVFSGRTWSSSSDFLTAYRRENIYMTTAFICTVQIIWSHAYVEKKKWSLCLQQQQQQKKKIAVVIYVLDAVKAWYEQSK